MVKIELGIRTRAKRLAERSVAIKTRANAVGAERLRVKFGFGVSSVSGKVVERKLKLNYKNGNQADSQFLIPNCIVN